MAGNINMYMVSGSTGTTNLNLSDVINNGNFMTTTQHIDGSLGVTGPDTKISTGVVATALLQALQPLNYNFIESDANINRAPTVKDNWEGEINISRQNVQFIGSDSSSLILQANQTKVLNLSNATTRPNVVSYDVSTGILGYQPTSSGATGQTLLYRLGIDPSSNQDPTTGGLIVNASSTQPGPFNLPLTKNITGAGMLDSFVNDPDNIFSFVEGDDKITCNVSGEYLISASLFSLSNEVAAGNYQITQLMYSGQNIFQAPPGLSMVSNLSVDLATTPIGSIYNRGGGDSCSALVKLNSGDNISLVYRLNSDSATIQLVSTLCISLPSSSGGGGSGGSQDLQSVCTVGNSTNTPINFTNEIIVEKQGYAILSTLGNQLNINTQDNLNTSKGIFDPTGRQIYLESTDNTTHNKLILDNQNGHSILHSDNNNSSNYGYVQVDVPNTYIIGNNKTLLNVNNNGNLNAQVIVGGSSMDSAVILNANDNLTTAQLSYQQSNQKLNINAPNITMEITNPNKKLEINSTQTILQAGTQYLSLNDNTKVTILESSDANLVNVILDSSVGTMTLNANDLAILNAGEITANLRPATVSDNKIVKFDLISKQLSYGTGGGGGGEDLLASMAIGNTTGGLAIDWNIGEIALQKAGINVIETVNIGGPFGNAVKLNNHQLQISQSTGVAGIEILSGTDSYKFAIAGPNDLINSANNHNLKLEATDGAGTLNMLLNPVNKECIFSGSLMDTFTVDNDVAFKITTLPNTATNNIVYYDTSSKELSYGVGLVPITSTGLFTFSDANGGISAGAGYWAQRVGNFVNLQLGDFSVQTSNTPPLVLSTQLDALSPINMLNNQLISTTCVVSLGATRQLGRLQIAGGILSLFSDISNVTPWPFATNCGLADPISISFYCIQ